MPCALCTEEKPEAGRLLGFVFCLDCGFRHFACHWHRHVLKTIDPICDDCYARQKPAIHALIFVRRIREERNDSNVTAPL